MPRFWMRSLLAIGCLVFLPEALVSAQDVPPAAQPSPSPSPSPSPDPAARPRISYADGQTTFEFAGGSLSISNRAQFRFTHEMPEEDLQLPGTQAGGDSKGSFRIRRAKTEFSGWVFRKELTYELQLSWAGAEPGASTTEPLEDFILTWDASGDQTFQIAVGQFKVPLGRQELTSSNRLQFVERDLLSGEFTRGRDIGVQLQGLLAKGRLEYRAGIFNGNPASRLGNDNDKYQYNARVTWQPWGDVRYSESDFESEDKPLLAVAAQFEKNDLHGVTNATDFDTTILGGDVALKYRGLSIFAEYFGRERKPETGASFDSNGFHAQAGYFLKRNVVEVAVRHARFDPSSIIPDNDVSETGAGVNYYLNRHNLKIQADFRTLKDEGRERNSKELRVQTQVRF
jgi:phosphate-selective porin OprO and OprP